MEKKINVLIIHYNTPRLTECLVKSINRFTPNSHIYIFDNSDKLPFKAKFDNVTIFDNTNGKYINFDKWLEQFPNRFDSGGRINEWGSAKHCISVEKCMSLIEGGFILLDSDVLVKRDISDLFLPQYAYVGEVETHHGWKTKRVCPFICYINSDMCKSNGVHYFDPNKMHGLKYTVNSEDADKYDTGAGLYAGCENLQKKEIWVDKYVVHFSGGSWISVKGTIARYKHHFNAEQWLRRYAKYWAAEEELEKMRNRKVIYTCITGGYEELAEPVVVANDFDYVCFTDSNVIRTSVWEFRPIPPELTGLTAVKQQRCIKICPHKYLPEYDLSIWVDGSVKLTGNPNDFLSKECTGNSVIFIPQHPKRKCIYKEEEAVVGIKKDKKSITWPQMLRYMKEGFPKDYGLVQSNIVVRRHNDPRCKKFMDAWCAEVKSGSHRDQLSFDYVRWKFKDVPVTMLDKGTCNSEWFQWDNSHGKRPKRVEREAVAGVVANIRKHAQNARQVKPEMKRTAADVKSKIIKSNPIARKKAVSERLANFLRV